MPASRQLELNLQTKRKEHAKGALFAGRSITEFYAFFLAGFFAVVVCRNTPNNVIFEDITAFMLARLQSEDGTTVATNAAQQLQILLAGGVMRIRKIRDEADARACLAAVRAAGGDRIAWAHAYGVDARSFNAWRVALERRAAKRSAAAAPKLIELAPSSAPHAPRGTSSTSAARASSSTTRARRTRCRVSSGAARMLSLPPSVRVFVAVAPIDMRGSFDALAGAVRRLGLDPVDGHVYAFFNEVIDQRRGDDAEA